MKIKYSAPAIAQHMAQVAKNTPAKLIKYQAIADCYIRVTINMMTEAMTTYKNPEGVFISMENLRDQVRNVFTNRDNKKVYWLDWLMENYPLFTKVRRGVSFPNYRRLTQVIPLADTVNHLLLDDIYEAASEPYVYMLTELSSGKWYLGARWKYGCNPSDGYMSSSHKVNQLVWASPTNWVKTILATGSREHVRQLETQLHRQLDSRNCAQSYNFDPAPVGGLGLLEFIKRR